MPTFTHDGVEIAYLDEGSGEPIVLVHGFASNKETNWVNPAWVSTLTPEIWKGRKSALVLEHLPCGPARQQRPRTAA